ncbi:L-histidine N(alpha)-methyltransferase [Pseudomonadota bacterium]
MRLIDYHPPRADMRADVVAGLSTAHKQLSPKYFYDERGSHLFEDITRLPEYYLTRTEARIMQAALPEMSRKIGPHAAVIEFGSGTGEKIRRLLQYLESPAACVTVEISRNHLLAAADRLAMHHPELDVIAVCADFTQPFRLPSIPGARRNLVFFPGSTIGNFNRTGAIHLLKTMRQVAGENGGLLMGVDLVKDKRVLEAAYNDSEGITAAFNLNLLRRINKELGADFQLDAFRHQADYNANETRIEMYLVSERAQHVTVAGKQFDFAEGERVLTEYSHKYDLPSFAQMAESAGLDVKQVWTDAKQLFSVQYLQSNRNPPAD